MKLFTGWIVSAGLVFAATGAQAQSPTPQQAASPSYRTVSDFSGPYATTPPAAPAPAGHYGYGPTLLPPTEVYTVLRENGFSPLGIPHQRGFVYTIAVIDRGGNDGRLAIDARDGRIIRFLPGNRFGGDFNDDVSLGYGRPGALPPVDDARAQHPSKSEPRVASRSVPVPKPSPLAAKPAPQPAQQSAAVQPKPAEVPPAPPAAAPTVAQAKPSAPAIQPTQDMPKAQGLD